MKRSLEVRLRRVEAKVPREVDEDPRMAAANRSLYGEWPLPDGMECMRVLRCVRERWPGRRRKREYIDEMPEWEIRRVEEIIGQFRGFGWPPEGWDGVTLPEEQEPSGTAGWMTPSDVPRPGKKS